MAQKIGDLLGRLAKGPAGLGKGVQFLIGAAAVGYGVRESIYNGEINFFLSFFSITIKLIHHVRFGDKHSLTLFESDRTSAKQFAISKSTMY